MNEVVGSHETLAAIMWAMGAEAKKAAAVLQTAPTVQKNDALNAIAARLRADADPILAANAQDIAAMKDGETAASFIDRATLNPERIEAMAKGLEDIAALDDPVGSTVAQWDRPNGLQIERVRTPLGVIGVIYESRPNVTADAGGLCLKSGNAVILRGGSSTQHSNAAIHSSITKGLKDSGLPESAIQYVPVTDRAAVGEMLAGLDGNIDVIVPRGGKSLVERVQTEARVPVFAHLEGLCHMFIDQSADLTMSVELVVNSKLRRTGICGALETLLVHRAVAESHLPQIAGRLLEEGCELRGDSAACALIGGMKPANDTDWTTEYLAPILSVRIVDDLDGAIEHIQTYGSDHTDSIIADDQETADAFLSRVDSAIVIHNASTQFADGGEFGMGAEIGIATGKMHARGPVGVEQLTSFKYKVRGSGQARP